MTPIYHAKINVKKWGGVLEDYLPIHNFLDQTKSAHADMRHRALLHNSLGPTIIESVFGQYITNTNGKVVPTRLIAERHIIEDLGFIPNVSDYLNEMKLTPWMMGAKKKKNNIVNIIDEE